MVRFPRRLSASLACALGLWLGLGSYARADEPSRSAALEWVRLPGAEACRDGLAVARAVEAKLGHTVFRAESEALLLIEGRVERTEHGYRARLELRDAEGHVLGTRELLSAPADCVELSEAVAVVLAVMVDPEGAVAARTPAPEVDAPPAPTPAPAAPTLPARPSPPRATAPPPPHLAPLAPEADLTAFARVAVGQLPRAAPGVGVAFELGIPGWGGLRLEGAGFLDQRRTLSAQPSAGARLRMLYGGLSLCPLWMKSGALRVSMCGGVQLGVVQTRAFGLDAALHDASEWLAQAEASLRLAYRLAGPVAISAGVSFVVPVVRTLYEAELADGSRATLYEQRAVGGAFDAGLGAHF